MKLLLAALLLCSATALAADPKSALLSEIKRYGHDAKSIALAPRHWTHGQWTRFGEGATAVAILYVADRRLYDAVQRNRTSFTNDFAKAVTPFGGQRAEDVSLLLIGAGLWTHDANMRDAGRDSLEAEILAGGIVTPLLKRTFGRARPIQDEGSHSFHPGSSKYHSFPSGHATNAFAFATAIAAHYDNWVVPTIVYTLASGVAVSRVNDRAHFPSDVLAGALIGRGIAKAIVHRHQRPGAATWTITPGVIDKRPAVMVHVITR